MQLEEHSANLANLYAATYQLHATLEPDAVVNCIVEISVNLIGAAEFALYLLEETKSDFTLRVREGDLPPEITHLPEPVYPLEQAAVRSKSARSSPSRSRRDRSAACRCSTRTS